MKKQSWIEKDVIFVTGFRKKVASTGLTGGSIRSFRRQIYKYYKTVGRDDLTWRNTNDPYHILVSEIMLQQTQVERVKRKYAEFIAAFPTLKHLADAPLSKVMKVWQGMGYNRRALMLKRAAECVIKEHGGELPNDIETLRTLPGIGAATACEIASFAFDQPTVFIETNIRTVFIHFFFDESTAVHDKEIMPLIERTLDRKDPRHWYYALMDYGVMLKAVYPNPSRRSVHYKKQSAFHGSDRKIRGGVIRVLTARERTTIRSLVKELEAPEYRVKKNVEKLVKEGLVKQQKNSFCIA
ncbi:MAG: A/G-specific adenine glycosylase [Candidatus Omnitrophica bacterium]|nr:A/G-specific adenine glycosylase [Candidatus Omnitrophota bacterium]